MTLKLGDILGREVATLVHEIKNAGMYEVRLDGSKLSSGACFYRLHADAFAEVKKLLLIR